MVATTNDAESKQKIASLVDEFSPKFPNAPEITPEVLLSQSAGNPGKYTFNAKPVVVVDVRTHDETEVSVIKNAVTKKAFEANLLADPRSLDDHVVVAYCTIGYRSAGYVEKLRSGRNMEAYNLRGSILAWTHAGGELEDQEKNVTKKVHVFGESWDLASRDCESVYFKQPKLSYVSSLVPDALKPWRWFGRGK